jgi:hypothetical protein
MTTEDNAADDRDNEDAGSVCETFDTDNVLSMEGGMSCIGKTKEIEG